MAQISKTAGTAFLVFMILFSSSIQAENTKNENPMYSVKSTSFTVYFAKTADIETLFDNLDNRKADTDTEWTSDSEFKTEAALLIKRIEAVFTAVKEKSGLNIELTGRERIIILKDQTALQAMFKKLYGVEYKDGISFYSAKLKTVFTAEDAMTARILAHELTHMVNDLHYNGKLDTDADEKAAYKMETLF